MKIFFRTILAAFGFIACNKTSVSSSATGNSTGQITSVKINQPSQDFIGKDTFRYDAGNNLLSFTTESINIPDAPLPEYDSGTLYFVIDPATGLPSGYTEDYRKYLYSEDYQYKHTLFYDAQQRLSIDSVTDILKGPDDFKTISYYTYTANTVKIETAFDGTTLVSVLDSLIMEGGNVTGRSEYDINGTDTTLSYRWTVNVSTGVANPFYDQKKSATLGAFYLFRGVGDFLSHDITQYSSEKFTWTKNAEGKVVSGLGDAGTTIKFSYQ